MRVLMVSQFYPPIAGGQEQHVRNLAHALVDRGHRVEVVTIATDGPAGTTLDGAVPLHHIRTTTQRLPGLYSDSVRPHAMPIMDPGFRTAIAQLLAGGKFDIVHAHDWSVGSAISPARHAGVPVVLSQHEYSHVCATKRLIRGGVDVCPGPTPIACVRCASSWYETSARPGRCTDERSRPPQPHQTCGRLHPGQLGRSDQHRATWTESLCGHPKFHSRRPSGERARPES